MKLVGLCLGIALAAVLVVTRVASSQTPATSPDVAVPAAAFDPASSATSEVAVLAGGCFWGMEGVFEHVRGVTSAVAGYDGGKADTATYPQVSTGTTGHAESVQITFDPRVVSYGKLLQIYFAVAHDPTELNFQGPDTGTQYRSEIFATDAAQAQVARAYITQLSKAKVFSKPIVTRIQTGTSFYRAEAEHQHFMQRNPDYPYIVANDAPKLVALQKEFADRYTAAWQ